MARRPIESDSEQEHEYSDENEQEYDDNEQGSVRNDNNKHFDMIWSHSTGRGKRGRRRG